MDAKEFKKATGVAISEYENGDLPVNIAAINNYIQLSSYASVRGLSEIDKFNMFGMLEWIKINIKVSDTQMDYIVGKCEEIRGLYNLYREAYANTSI